MSFLLTRQRRSIVVARAITGALMKFFNIDVYVQTSMKKIHK